MAEFLGFIVGGLLLYVGYLHLQLYINRRVIASLRATNVTLVEKPATQEYRPMLAAVGGIILVVLVLVASGG